MELSFSDGYAETPVVALGRKDLGVRRTSLDDFRERREPSEYAVASHGFPLNRIPHSIC